MNTTNSNSELFIVNSVISHSGVAGCVSVTGGKLESVRDSYFQAGGASATVYALSVTGSGTMNLLTNSSFIGTTGNAAPAVIVGGQFCDFSKCIIAGVGSTAAGLVQTPASTPKGTYSFSRTDLVNYLNNASGKFIQARGATAGACVVNVNTCRFVLGNTGLTGTTNAMSPFGVTGSNNVLEYFNNSYLSSATTATTVQIPTVGGSWIAVRRSATEEGFVGPSGATGSQGTIIFFGYAGSTGPTGASAPYGSTGFGPTGAGYPAPRVNDFFLNLSNGQLSRLQ
jgi:hypothetical protein